VVEWSLVEAVGYVASALVVASLAMTSVVRLRTISLVGSLVFVAYGLLIDSVPILITNTAIAALNLWFLRSELGMHRDLGVTVVPHDSPFLADFVHFHLADIRRFQDVVEVPAGGFPPDTFALVLNRDGLPAGVLVGRRDGDRLVVQIDHVLRAYRDSRLGNWLYGAGSTVFRDAGFRTVVATPGSGPEGEVHRQYLERVGFRRAGGHYELSLSRGA
jgi:hypothetical protein